MKRPDLRDDRPWWQRVTPRRIAAFAVRCAVVVAIVVLLRGGDPLDCETADQDAPPPIAVEVCRAEYHKTRALPTGVRYARALYATLRLDDAWMIASGLEATDVRADAHLVMGQIEQKRGRLDRAQKLLASAKQSFAEHGDRAGVARTARVLAALHILRETYGPALELLGECIANARAAGDQRTEGICHLIAASALWRIGMFRQAREALTLADPLLTSELDRAQLAFERGNIEQEVVRSPTGVAHNELAVAYFHTVLTHAARAQRPVLTEAAHQNLAYSYLELDRIDEAERHLAIAYGLDHAGTKRSSLAGIEALLHYKRGNFEMARRRNLEALVNPADREDEIDVSSLQARIALETGDLPLAEKWARAGIAIAEETRGEQPVDLRSWMLASRREPYELLFKTLVRAGRLEDALVMLDRWHGRTLLDAIVRPSLDASLDLAKTGSQVELIARWLGQTRSAPLIAEPPGAEALAALRAVDLLALAVIDKDVWVITVLRGGIRIRRVDSWANLELRLSEFRATPTDPQRAAALGSLILGADVHRATREPLRVLLDGPLAALPIAALRRDGVPLIAMRPVLRVTRLFDTRCVPPATHDGATVIGDAHDNLPAAAAEARAIAGSFRAPALLGAGATSTALFAANRSALLHAAVHGEVGHGGGTLVLRDRVVSALEIAARKLGPPLVVLPVCLSAAANDDELFDALAIAFLAAGSRQVVATLTAVSDDGAAELIRLFYGAGGTADPVRALADASAALSSTSNLDWPHFAVFGHDVCPSTR